MLDLDYAEDATAETDMNVVMNDAGAIVEIQGTAEGHAFRRDELDQLLGATGRADAGNSAVDWPVAPSCSGSTGVGPAHRDARL